MDNDQRLASPETESEEERRVEEESFGWSFHKWPFLVALAMTAIFYLLIYLLVDTSTGPLGR